MQVTSQVDAGKAVFTLTGKLTVQTAPQLADAIDQLPNKVSDIDIDLRGVDYVSSAGLRVFVKALNLATQRGGTMRLLHPRDEVLEALDMTGLTYLLHIVR